MGSWGYKTFEDDTALDWIGEFARKPGMSVIDAAMERTANADEFIDDRAAAGALCAAEVVAAMNGRPAPNLPEKVAFWASKQGAPSSHLRANCRGSHRPSFQGL
jgi:hypothetical protein